MQVPGSPGDPLIISDSGADSDSASNRANAVPFLSPQSKLRRKARRTLLVDSDQSDADEASKQLPPLNTQALADLVPRMSMSPEPDLMQIDEVMQGSPRLEADFERNLRKSDYPGHLEIKQCYYCLQEGWKCFVRPRPDTTTDKLSCASCQLHSHKCSHRMNKAGRVTPVLPPHLYGIRKAGKNAIHGFYTGPGDVHRPQEPLPDLHRIRATVNQPWDKQMKRNWSEIIEHVERLHDAVEEDQKPALSVRTLTDRLKKLRKIRKQIKIRADPDKTYDLVVEFAVQLRGLYAMISHEGQKDIEDRLLEFGVPGTAQYRRAVETDWMA